MSSRTEYLKTEEMPGLGNILYIYKKHIPAHILDYENLQNEIKRLVKEDDATPCWYNFREHLTIQYYCGKHISVQDKCFARGILFPEINACSHAKKKL